METILCECPDIECRLHRDRPCGQPSRVDGFAPSDEAKEYMIPLCTACAGHAVSKGFRLRARPHQPLGR